MSTTKRQPRSRPETLARRRDILQAAMEIFGSKGYKNGALTDIAEQVDMTHAGILHHFGSKDALLLEVLTYRDETDVQDLVEKHIPGGMELFRHLVRTAFANAKRAGIVQTFAVLSAESVTDDHPAREYFENRYRQLRSDVSAAFEQVCAEHGVDDQERVGLASASIIGVMDGLQVQWLLDPTAIDLGTTTEFAIEAIVAAVLTPSPNPLV